MPADRLGQAEVCITNHELDLAQAELFDQDQGLAPETLALTDTNLETNQLTAAVSIGAHDHHDGHGADLQGLAEAAVEVGRI